MATLSLDVEKCGGCEMCATVCPHRVFAMADHRAQIVDLDGCMECGACATNCPDKAITVDVGVGCAAAIILGALRGTEPNCDCQEEKSCCG